MANHSGATTEIAGGAEVGQTHAADLRRVSAILGAVGGALVVASYFLPWTGGPRVSGSPSADNLVVFTGWDLAVRVASGIPYTTGTDQLTSQGSIPYALLATAPMLMGAIVAVLGAWAFFQRPDGLRAGLNAAAASLAALPSFGTLNSGAIMNAGVYGYQFGYGGFGPLPPNHPLVGLGPVVLYIGLFATIAGGVGLVIRRRS